MDKPVFFIPIAIASALACSSRLPFLVHTNELAEYVWRSPRLKKIVTGKLITTDGSAWERVTILFPIF